MLIVAGRRALDHNFFIVVQRSRFAVGCGFAIAAAYNDHRGIAGFIHEDAIDARP